MSKAEELLSSAYIHDHPVPDTDTYFIIDPITRKIENTNRKKHVIMQYDHNSERFTFELPRFIDGHDMLECTSVTVNVDNIEDGDDEPFVNSDAPDITDLRLHPNDPEKVICSWLISRNSTQLAGHLSFHIEYKCVDSDGNVVYEWSTDSYDDIEVKARNKNGDAVVIEHADLLEQWRTKIFGAGDSVMADIAAEGKTQVAAVKAESTTQQNAVELKGVNTLESIPEDYTETSYMAKEAVRTKADAIICSAEGDNIFVSDSSNDHVRGLKIFGKTTQFTTTGKNLFDRSSGFKGVNGGRASWDNEKLTVTGAMVYVTIPVKANTVYTVSYKSTRTGPVGGGIYIRAKDSTGAVTALKNQQNELNSNATFTTPSSAEVIDIMFYGSAETSDQLNYAVFSDIQLELGNAVTAYEPYTGGIPAPNPDYTQDLVSIENATVRVCGKNLLENKFASGYSETYRGVTFTFGPDRSITVSGTPTAAIAYDISENVYMPAGVYYLSGAPATGSAKFRLQVNPTVDGKEITGTVDGGNGGVLTLDADRFIRSYIYIASDAGKVSGVFYPQLEKGNIATNYEPYLDQPIYAPHAIPGIPVTSGGNYTDENGQQWICDEIDFERGVYVQRVHTDTITPEKINRVDNAYVSAGGSIAYFVPTYQHMQNDDVRLAMSNWCAGIPCKERNTRTDEYRCYAPASDPNVITLRYPTSSGEKTLDEAKIDFGGRSLMYVLRDPIETPIDGTTMVAFKALRTNYHNTTILNDAGAWMSVKYNADTKTYVENPKVLKLVDSSTGVVYELKIVDGQLTVVKV